MWEDEYKIWSWLANNDLHDWNDEQDIKKSFTITFDKLQDLYEEAMEEGKKKFIEKLTKTI